MSDIEDLVMMQYKLLEIVRGHIVSLTGYDSEDLIRYEHEFISAFEKSDPEVAEQEKLLKRIDQSSMVLMGDFHSMPSNQMRFLNIVQHIVSGSKSRKVLIALECLFEEDEENIQRFLQGEIDASDLKQVLDFDRTWGFSWWPIEEILCYAREHGLAVIALNSRKIAMQGPAMRDLQFAMKLKRALSLHVDGKLLALIGEYHLSPNHLPLALSRELPGLCMDEDLTVIFCGMDQLYFRLLRELSSSYTGLWHLGHAQFVYYDAPPWGKWLSWLLLQESSVFLNECGECHDPLSCGECWPGNEDILKECWLQMQVALKWNSCDFTFPSVILGLGASDLSKGRACRTSSYVYDRIKFDPVSEVLSLASMDWESLLCGLGVVLLRQFRAVTDPSNPDPDIPDQDWMDALQFVFHPLGSSEELVTDTLMSEGAFSLAQKSSVRKFLVQRSHENMLGYFLRQYLLNPEMSGLKSAVAKSMQDHSSGTDASLFVCDYKATS
ncbi:MAG: ChaN family lipoprotein [Deltaproteobacteria bacterium]|nr:ChaN family lipoprotein [Deltaproteobacteria bacterium]